MSKIFFGLAFLFFYKLSWAGIFGPSNFNECVRNLSSSSKNLEIADIKRICYSEFPALSRLAKNKNATLVCRGHINTDSNEILNLIVRSQMVKVSDGKDRERESNDIPIMTRTKEFLIFSFTGQDAAAVTANLNIEYGNLNITRVSPKSKKETWFFKCTETGA